MIVGNSTIMKTTHCHCFFCAKRKLLGALKAAGVTLHSIGTAALEGKTVWMFRKSITNFVMVYKTEKQHTLMTILMMPVSVSTRLLKAI